MNAVLLKHKRFNQLHGWCLEINDVLELAKYFLESGKYEKIFLDYSKKVRGVIKHEKGDTYLVQLRAERKNISFINELSELSKEQFISMKNILDQDKTVYINKNGGYFFDDNNKTYTVLERKDVKKVSDLYELMEAITGQVKNIDKIRYSQWPGGTHWYARVGENEDIKDNKGNIKWDTLEEAKEAAKWFLKNRINL